MVIPGIIRACSIPGNERIGNLLSTLYLILLQTAMWFELNGLMINTTPSQFPSTHTIPYVPVLFLNTLAIPTKFRFRLIYLVFFFFCHTLGVFSKVTHRAHFTSLPISANPSSLATPTKISTFYCTQVTHNSNLSSTPSFFLFFFFTFVFFSSFLFFYFLFFFFFSLSPIQPSLWPIHTLSVSLRFPKVKPSRYDSVRIVWWLHRYCGANGILYPIPSLIPLPSTWFN